ncbi:MAG: EAL domain-containing protein [Rubellimicrobium sp.]|nr:EAL domain-containing protein [Rubellimicrobium sp.]
MPPAILRRLGAILSAGTDDRRATLLFLGPVLSATAWIGFGPVAGLAALLGLPALALALPAAPARFCADPGARAQAERLIDRTLARLRRDEETCAFVLRIGAPDGLSGPDGQEGGDIRPDRVAARIGRILAPGGRILHLDGPTFAVVPGASRRFDMESALALSARLQRAAGEAAAAGRPGLIAPVAIGFALSSRLGVASGAELLRAARLAAFEAARNGPGAIRSYSPCLDRRSRSRDSLLDEVEQALDSGQIVAWFQPQLRCADETLSGCEALARWIHPVRGLIPPSEFLPVLHQAGLMPRLGARMLTEAVTALNGWDGAGLHVPRVGINLSPGELADPALPERVAFTLDRHGIAPGRLGIEVLESVAAGTGDDAVSRNLGALARQGCLLDLDDFGTGHAAITAIRRLSIARIKIDRTFVTRIDSDRDQQDMVAAILTMAARLHLDTLAEGVETAAEQAMLGRLGCGHVQGFAIARPMPLAEATAWIAAREERARTPVLPLRRLSG